MKKIMKSLSLLLAVGAMAFGSGLHHEDAKVAKAATTLTVTGSTATETDGVQNITIDGIEFSGKFKKYQTQCIWLTKSAGYFYNKTDLGKIKSVDITYNGGGSESASQAFSFNNTPISSYTKTPVNGNDPESLLW